VKGHGYVIEGIYFLCVIVILQIHEESFFIGEVPVAGKVVVYLEVVGSILDVSLFVASQSTT
jgi:hypothetical protein